MIIKKFVVKQLGETAACPDCGFRAVNLIYANKKKPYLALGRCRNRECKREFMIYRSETQAEEHHKVIVAEFNRRAEKNGIATGSW